MVTICCQAVLSAFCQANMQCRGSTVQHSLTSHAVMQSVYSAIPYALSPVLGNPLAMAAVNVDRTASLPTQVLLPLTARALHLHSQQ